MEMQEWIVAANLNLSVQLESLNVAMNKELVEILIGNLFRNAIKHSKANDTIIVKTGNDRLIISNTGKVM